MLDWARGMFSGRVAKSSGGAKATMRYFRPDSTGILRGWLPSLRSKSDDVRAAWSKGAAMAIDVAQNQGWIAGAINQNVVDTIGPMGLTLNAVPDFDELGWTQDYAHEWSRNTERRFRSYSRNPLEVDVRGRQDLAGLSDAYLRQRYFYGEGTARILVKPRSISQADTRVQLFSPHRVVQDTSELQGLYQGVFIDADGLPIGYRVKTRIDGFDQILDLPARDGDGRPVIVHTFDGDADETRGITPLAPVLKVTRQKDTLADATMTAALLQTIFAASYSSAAPSEEAFEGFLSAFEGSGQGDLGDAGAIGKMMEASHDYYDAGGLDLGTFGKVAKLFPGDKLEFHSVNNPGNNYLPFDRQLSREIAAALGMTMEAFTGDYDGASYSSIQMGIASRYPLVVRQRQRHVVPFVRAVYEAWLEEQIFKGLIPFPGGYSAFLRKRQAASRSEWRGPPKPRADDLKTAKALQAMQQMGIFSVQTLSAEAGVDWEEEMDQQAQESARALKLGRPDPHAPRQMGAPIDLNDPSLADEDPTNGRPAGRN